MRYMSSTLLGCLGFALAVVALVIGIVMVLAGIAVWFT